MEPGVSGRSTSLVYGAVAITLSLATCVGILAIGWQFERSEAGQYYKTFVCEHAIWPLWRCPTKGD